MADNSAGRRNLAAVIMLIGLVVGLVLYFYLAFVMRIPGFESAPAMMACWAIALLLATILVPSRKS